MIPYLLALSLIYPFWWAVAKLATLKQPIYVLAYQVAITVSRRLVNRCRHWLMGAVQTNQAQ